MRFAVAERLPEDRFRVAMVCFGTIESTRAVNCLLHGIPCFLCGWLSLSSFEHVQQCVLSEIGDPLRDASGVFQIPRRPAASPAKLTEQQSLRTTVDLEVLRQGPTAGSEALSDARRVP
jgi:hypothetical protein